MNGFADAEVGAAPAEISAHRVIDIRIAGFRVRREQCSSGHDLPRLAVAALRNLLGNRTALPHWPGAAGLHSSGWLLPCGMLEVRRRRGSLVSDRQPYPERQAPAAP
jgi:hypothetical protein